MIDLTFRPPLVIFASLCTLIASSAQADNFGDPGRNGQNGRNGSPGRNGPNIATRARGKHITIDVRGSDGHDGENGESASHPRCRQPRHVHHDLYARNGSNGGNGGNGGSGGNAGDVTAHYNKRSHLKKIRILAAPGQGGEGGRPGYASEGCRCEFYRWKVKECKKIKIAITPHRKEKTNHNNGKNQRKQKPDSNTKQYRYVRRCRIRHLRCYDGHDGVPGSPGQQGSNGLPGRIFLVKGHTALIPDVLVQERSLIELSRNPVMLSKNIWTSHHGSRRLFAPGSRVSSRYYKYVKNSKFTYKIKWKSKHNIEKTPGNIKLLIEDKYGKPVLSRYFSSNLWLISSKKTKRNYTLETITDGILRNDAMRVNTSISGFGTGTKIFIKDNSVQAKRLTTSFKLSIKRSKFLSWKTLFNGLVPDSAIDKNNGQFVINLTRLPIDKKYLGSNRRIKINLTIVRRFHHHSGTVNFKKKYSMPSDDEYEGD